MSENGFLAESYVERTADETRRRYDDWAETYDQELAANAYAMPARSLAAFQPLVADVGAEILDVGCGTGLFGRQLNDAGYSTIDGCDYSAGMLEQARNTGLYRRLFQANLNEPPLNHDTQPMPPDSYDAAAVIGVFSFGHVNAIALDEIARVVSPGGIIVVGLNVEFWNEGSLRSRLDHLATNKVVTIVGQQATDHLPGTSLNGMVISLRVN